MFPATTAPAAAVQVGTAVVLTDESGSFDKGDAGIVTEVHHEGGAWVEFHEGGAGMVPLSVLAVHVREFAYRTTARGISRTVYSSEEAAAEAAEQRGHLVFKVIEVQTVAAYRVEHIEFDPAAALAA